MSVLLLPLILVATLLVILSGIWVTIALIDAVRHVERPVEGVPASDPAPTVRDTGKNVE